MALTDAQKREAATKFYNDWHGIGDEKSDSQRFWIEFFTNVLGIEDVTQKIIFEKRVIIDGQTKFIDVYIPETRVLIEQKSITKELDQKIPQSGGLMMTPFEQGRNYAHWMLPNETPLWIVACNFKSFEIHNMSKPQEEPLTILLSEIQNKFSLFDFMFKSDVKEISHEMEISVKAGEIVGILYDKLLVQYSDPDESSLKSLNALCVRLVFCLYAEDAGIFGSRMMFHDYLEPIPATGMRKALVELFKILDTKYEERDKYLADDNPALAAFPYVNGGLFADESIEIPPFTEELKELLIKKASSDFDWSAISPTIFGAVFESTLNPETRRSGGMHYTSIENIHKLIDPLFLESLEKEFTEIAAISAEKTRNAKLDDFHAKIASLNFLDPACGSGNFLTETYISLRKLENRIIMEQTHGQMVFGEAINPIKVSITQFFGIEINDFAVTVAKTALWIAESQMLKETEDIIHMQLDFLPLKTNASVEEANALSYNWEQLIPKYNLSYIMGNPPFVGYSLQNKEQKNDILSIYVDEKGKPYKTAGKIDYVSGWYFKAAQMIHNTKIKAAFVSTNSITQGEQVSAVWKPLHERFGIQIDFAYQSFKWESEASIKAQVYCVIIGFSCIKNHEKKRLYSTDNMQLVDNINFYLLDADNVFIESKSKPICDNIPVLQNGGKPTEGGFLILTEEEKDELINTNPYAKEFIRPYMMGKDFIARKPRYCIWLVNANPSDIKKCPEIMERVKKVREYRLQSPKEATRKKADTPMLFDEVRECSSDYVAIPKVSAGTRRYVPIEYLSSDIIPGDKLFMIQNSDLYTFGIITSNVHMSWMRAVASYLSTSYSYSNTIVYNNFPWPSVTEAQKEKIIETAKGILSVREQFPNSSLADLYDEILMPPALRKAHQLNDKAVMQAYGLPIKETTESSCVAMLMKMYQEKI